MNREFLRTVQMMSLGWIAPSLILSIASKHRALPLAVVDLLMYAIGLALTVHLGFQRRTS